MDPVAFLPPLSESVARLSEVMVPSLLTVLARTTVVLLLGLLVGACLERQRTRQSRVAPIVRAAVYRVTLAATALVLFVTLVSGVLRPLAASPSLVRMEIPGAPQPRRDRLPRLLMIREVRTVGENRLSSAPRDRIVMIRSKSGFGSGPSPLPSLYAGFFALYGLVTALLLSVLMLGICQLRRLSRSAQTLPGNTRLGKQIGAAWQSLSPASLPGSRPLPRLAAAAGLDGPFIADSPALSAPTVFVPMEAADDWSDEEAHGIFAHELAHYARRDGIWNLAARVLSALLWCQPLMPLLLRRLEEATEESCDQEALAAGGCAPQSLARCLLALAERREGRRRRSLFGRRGGALAPTLGAVSSPFRSSIGRRVTRILESGEDGGQRQSVAGFSTRTAFSLLASTVIAPVAAASLISVEARPAAAPPPLRLRVATADIDALAPPLLPGKSNVLFWKRETSVLSTIPHSGRSMTIVTATTEVREEYRQTARP